MDAALNWPAVNELWALNSCGKIEDNFRQKASE
jgi:hypothetical protein